jgi:hypothetical protein
MPKSKEREMNRGMNWSETHLRAPRRRADARHDALTGELSRTREHGTTKAQRTAWAFLLCADVKRNDFLRDVKVRGAGREVPLTDKQAKSVLRIARREYGWAMN